MRCLEVGYGNSRNSALITGGNIFCDEMVDFHTVSLPDDWTYVNREDRDAIRPVTGNWAALPYRSNAFSAVLMRSCFGQFTSNSDSPSLEHSLHFGLYEVSRVIEEGGTLFISEENTPQDLDRVIPFIMDAGFEIDRFEREFKEGKPNPAYNGLRSTYYGDSPLGTRSRGRGPSLHNQAYVIVATKAGDLEYSTRRVPAVNVLAHRNDTSDRWREPVEDIEVEFQIPADKDTLQRKIEIGGTMVRIAGLHYQYMIDPYEQMLAETEQR
ncbi:MAG TPA: hypothetical protein VMR34_01400 [Candidatus Saccharimonadales bacterium]|nr:hypothetical protein [Candidatus Saccharimonadales bacterium]